MEVIKVALGSSMGAFAGARTAVDRLEYRQGAGTLGRDRGT